MEDQNGHDFVLVEDNDIRDYNVAGVLPQTPETIAEIRKWL